MNGMPDPDAHDSSPPEHGSREDLLARIVSGELAVDAEPVQAAMQTSQAKSRNYWICTTSCARPRPTRRLSTK